MDADEQQIRQLVADWMAATKSGDVNRILDLMADDVVFLTPGNAPMTKADFAQAARAQTTSGMAIEGTSDIREVQVAGDWAFMWSHLSVSVKLPGQNEAIERAGHTLSIFHKQNGKWLLARDANLLTLIKK